MIPELEILVRTQEQIPVGKTVSCLKLHNGMAYRNPKVSFVVFHEREPILFLKSVRHTSDNSVVEHAHEALKHAYTDQQKYYSGLQVPMPQWCVSLGGYFVSAESIVNGRPLDIHNDDEVNQALQMLFTWQAAIVCGSVPQLDVAAVYHQLCAEMGCEERLRRQLDAQFERVLRRAEETKGFVPSISAHGDATPSNILIQPSRKLAAVDWDRYGDIGIPLFDLLTFIERVAQKNENPFKRYHVEIQRHLNIFQFSGEVFPLFAFLYVVATEWRKRLRVHPYERSVIDDDFEKTFLFTMKWIEAWN